MSGSRVLGSFRLVRRLPATHSGALTFLRVMAGIDQP
jgi:hypothetical protein